MLVLLLLLSFSTTPTSPPEVVEGKKDDDDDDAEYRLLLPLSLPAVESTGTTSTGCSSCGMDGSEDRGSWILLPLLPDGVDDDVVVVSCRVLLFLPNIRFTAFIVVLLLVVVFVVVAVGNDNVLYVWGRYAYDGSV